MMRLLQFGSSASKKPCESKSLVAQPPNFFLNRCEKTRSETQTGSGLEKAKVWKPSFQTQNEWKNGSEE